MTEYLGIFTENDFLSSRSNQLFVVSKAWTFLSHWSGSEEGNKYLFSMNDKMKKNEQVGFPDLVLSDVETASRKEEVYIQRAFKEQ